MNLHIFGEEITMTAGYLKSHLKVNKLLLVVNSDGITLLIPTTSHLSSSPTETPMLKNPGLELLKIPLKSSSQRLFSSYKKNSGNGDEDRQKYLIRILVFVFGYLTIIYLFHYLVVLCCKSSRQDEEEQLNSDGFKSLTKQHLDVLMRERKFGINHGKFNTTT